MPRNQKFFVYLYLNVNFHSKVNLGNGEVQNVKGIAFIHKTEGKSFIHDVFNVPKETQNLLRVGQLLQKG